MEITAYARYPLDHFLHSLGLSRSTIFLRCILGIHYQESPSDRSIQKAGAVGGNDGIVLRRIIYISDYSPQFRPYCSVGKHTGGPPDLLWIHSALRMDRLYSSGSTTVRPAPSRYAPLAQAQS